MTRWKITLAWATAAVMGLLAVTLGQVAGQPPSKGAKLGHAAQHKDMQLVGFNDLQARSAYQPTIHQHPDGRRIAYVGHHEEDGKDNGTSIVDVTDPTNPVYLTHIPSGDGAQMVRACNGRDLPNADDTKVYMLRATGSDHEVYDVTDPANPSLLTTVVANLGDTHKSWWECDTGIAYLVSDGRTLSTAIPPFPNWRTNRMTQIFDLSDPATPVFIRNYGLDGQQPGSTGPVPTGVHGPISIGPTGVRGVANRVYFGHGTGSNGILQIVDRAKLLDPNRCPTPPSPLWRTNPTKDDLLCPQIGRLDTSPTMGAHTTFPVLQVPVPEFAKHTQGKVRDVVVLVNEAGGNTAANRCPNNRQLVYIVDATVAPIGNLAANETRPMSIANFQVPEASGDFCDRGGRFGAHASNESFTEPFYGKLVFASWFNAGVRAIDIREPWSPREAGYYIPATTANTDERCATVGGQQICKIAIQTNNVEVDNRGLIYIVDRANTGMHILELTGDAKKIIE